MHVWREAGSTGTPVVGKWSGREVASSNVNLSASIGRGHRATRDKGRVGCYRRIGARAGNVERAKGECSNRCRFDVNFFGANTTIGAHKHHFHGVRRCAGVGNGVCAGRAWKTIYGVAVYYPGKAARYRWRVGYGGGKINRLATWANRLCACIQAHLRIGVFANGNGVGDKLAAVGVNHLNGVVAILQAGHRKHWRSLVEGANDVAQNVDHVVGVAGRASTNGEHNASIQHIGAGIVGNNAYHLDGGWFVYSAASRTGTTVDVGYGNGVSAGNILELATRSAIRPRVHIGWCAASSCGRNNAIIASARCIVYNKRSCYRLRLCNTNNHAGGASCSIGNSNTVVAGCKAYTNGGVEGWRERCGVVCPRIAVGHRARKLTFIEVDFTIERAKAGSWNAGGCKVQVTSLAKGKGLNGRRLAGVGYPLAGGVARRQAAYVAANVFPIGAVKTGNKLWRSWIGAVGARGVPGEASVYQNGVGHVLAQLPVFAVGDGA